MIGRAELNAVIMALSRPRTILCILLLLTSFASAPSQGVVDKTPTSTISGKVTVGGKGLQGVVVGLVISDQYGQNSRPTRFKSTTDEDGNYRITKVPPGTYNVTPASPVYVASNGRKTLIIGKNETVENVDIALEQGGVITGKVTDAEGRPVIEEMVSVFAASASQRVSYFRFIRTDDRGIYRAYGVPPGRYKVAAGTDANSSAGTRRPMAAYQRTYHPSTVDLAAATIIDVSEGSETTNVDITLGGPPRVYSARGRIIDSDTDKPMPNTGVGLQHFEQHGTSSSSGVAESSKDGEFKVENLPPGKYAVYSDPPAGADWLSEAVPFEVTNRDVEGLVIKVARGASVSGVVILEGTADPRVRANLVASRIVAQIVEGGYLGMTEPSATINPNGSFRITGLVAGRLMFRLEPREPFGVLRLERDGVVMQRGVEIGEHEQVTGLQVVVGQTNGSIRGVIQLPTGFELPANNRLSLVLRRTDLNPGRYGTPFDMDARGQFRIDKLVPGTYDLEIGVFTPSGIPRSLMPTTQSVTVTNGAVADVTITLQKPAPKP
jgi:Carboxypeptidase regulatory-like domain